MPPRNPPILRLQRVSQRNYPFYRIIATNQKAAAKAQAKEVIGTYNPQMKIVTCNKERIQYWIAIGAQWSETVGKILVHAGMLPKKPPTYMNALRWGKQDQSEAKYVANLTDKGVITPIL